MSVRYILFWTPSTFLGPRLQVLEVADCPEVHRAWRWFLMHPKWTAWRRYMDTFVVTLVAHLFQARSSQIEKDAALARSLAEVIELCPIVFFLHWICWQADGGGSSLVTSAYSSSRADPVPPASVSQYSSPYSSSLGVSTSVSTSNTSRALPG